MTITCQYCELTIYPNGSDLSAADLIAIHSTECRYRSVSPNCERDKHDCDSSYIKAGTQRVCYCPCHKEAHNG